MYKKKVAIIGSHGLYANYGGWDQLVRNLAEKKADNVEYLIFNSVETKKDIIAPRGVIVKYLKFKASGFQGLFYDFWSIIYCLNKVDIMLLLGVQGIPLLAVLRLFKKINIVSNVGGIEWERPKFGLFSKMYLKFCFKWSFLISDSVILDNAHYKIFLPGRIKSNVIVIPYGGEIDNSLDITGELEIKYPFLNDEYFLSISRSLEDNKLEELCETFVNTHQILVLISNFSNSSYGKYVLSKYDNISNIVLINGLYQKDELDLIRRHCKAYIHTHTLCGTAPSLVEMIIAQRPIISVNIPQNRHTLHEQAFFYDNFLELKNLLNTTKEFNIYIPGKKVCEFYGWNKIINDYEHLF